MVHAVRTYNARNPIIYSSSEFANQDHQHYEDVELGVETCKSNRTVPIHGDNRQAKIYLFPSGDLHNMLIHAIRCFQAVPLQQDLEIDYTMSYQEVQTSFN